MVGPPARAGPTYPKAGPAPTAAWRRLILKWWKSDNLSIHRMTHLLVVGAGLAVWPAGRRRAGLPAHDAVQAGHAVDTQPQFVANLQVRFLAERLPSPTAACQRTWGRTGAPLEKVKSATPVLRRFTD